jgi:hypothetical protein
VVRRDASNLPQRLAWRRDFCGGWRMRLALHVLCLIALLAISGCNEASQRRKCNFYRRDFVRDCAAHRPLDACIQDAKRLWPLCEPSGAR